MSDSSFNDVKRQEDEIKAIRSIYEPSEFSYQTTRRIECSFNAFVTINEKSLEVQYTDNSSDGTKACSRNVFIEHLPPARLFVTLPHSYPSKEPPEFYLVVSWLPQWQTSIVCQELDEIWLSNKGSEILFLWFNFLKYDLLLFLGITNRLDISFLSTVYSFPMDYLKSDLHSLHDPRAINRALFLNPLKFLTNFNKSQCKVEFRRKPCYCNICFEICPGLQCMQLAECKHIFCKMCLQQYISAKINMNRIKNITCPDANCSFQIEENSIKVLCPELFDKYNNNLFKMTLDTMNDVLYCPRHLCQFPVWKDSDDTLATCPKCGYNFCSFCQKVYHGVAPCVMTTEKLIELIKDYQNTDIHGKKLLEKKYGRRQIQIMVEKHLSAQYLKDNTKACPNCQAFITKVDGCNKMVCTYCAASFCWLCGAQITTENAYDHFLQRNKECFGRLFEGIINENYDFLNIWEAV